MSENEKEDFMDKLRNEISENLNKNYELLGRNYEAAFVELSGKDLKTISQNTGAKIIDDDKLALDFFEKQIIINPEEKKIYEDGKQGQLDFFPATLILHFILNADGTPLFGEWIQYRELSDGLFYASTIPGVLQPLVAFYGSDGSGFVRRIIELGGVINHDFKYAGVLYPFRRFPVLFILEEKDEEFDASLSVLFDKSASHYMKTDIIKTLLVYTVKILIT